VHEPGRVRRVERRRYLRYQRGGPAGLQPPAGPPDQRRQVTARHEPRRDVQQALGLAGRVNRDDVQ
jgi:hypothetical protein